MCFVRNSHVQCSLAPSAGCVYVRENAITCCNIGVLSIFFSSHLYSCQSRVLSFPHSSLNPGVSITYLFLNYGTLSNTRYIGVHQSIDLLLFLLYLRNQLTNLAISCFAFFQSESQRDLLFQAQIAAGNSSQEKIKTLYQNVVNKLHEIKADFNSSTPRCDVSAKDIHSALSRAPSEHCKREITDAYCDLQEGKLYPAELPRFCPLKGS